MKRVALYVRVSTQEQRQHGISINSQIDALKGYCEKHGLSVFSIYNDAGISARKKYKNRPELLRLMQDCKDGKIDLVLFTKLDRWFRSVADYYEVQSILDQAKVPWRAIWEDYETETSAGVFKVNIMLSIAQAESDRTSERIKAVNVYRKSQGQFVGGKAPRGYIRRDKQLIVDETLKPVIQKFFDTYLESFSISKAMDAIADQLFLPRNTASRMLKNEVYSGNAYGYPCYAYITPEQHMTILKSIEGRRNRTPQQNHNYLFSGLVRCKKCGRIMAGSISRSRAQGKDYFYKAYRCNGFSARTCDYGPHAFESTIEKILLSTLDDVVAEKNYIIQTSSKDPKENEKNIKRLQAKLSRIGVRFEVGDISKDEYISKRQEVMQQISDLQVRPDTKQISLPVNWQDTYYSLDFDHKKAFWNTILNRIVVSGRGKEKTYDIYV